jgi:2-keto-4-pentenoate hydratase/2-oxohepta-3-ene-1,7-dioic acid hydratase in catechol pathway
MKIYRYITDTGETHCGTLSTEINAERLSGNLQDGFKHTGQTDCVARLLAPLAPSSILCIGLNYRQHAAESNMAEPADPILFIKTPNCLQHPGAPIIIPTHFASDEVDYECELAVVIGKPCKNVRKENALDYVHGYTCANDVSARDWQLKRGGGQWCRGKCFDTFAPLGPCIVTTDEISDPNALAIKTIINGEILQDWTTSDMIFDVPAIIEFLSGSTTLLPGTVIMTGTPQGVGMGRNPQRWLKEGDEVTVEIEGIGRLTNPVIREL